MSEFARRPVGRRVFLGLLAGAGAFFATGVGLSRVRTVHYHDVSAMPFNGEEPTTALSNLVFRGPERWRYYSVAPVPSFDRATWRITVEGLVDRPQVIDYASLFSHPATMIRADFHCVTGWTVRGVRWQGISVRSLLEAAGPRAQARFVTFTSFDGLYRESYTLEQAMRPGCLIAYRLNGRLLEQREGAPARLVNPEMWGYKNLKWLSGIRLTEHREQGYWEQKGWCNPEIGDDTVDDCPRP